jgi:outer membrane immunogenic protein
MKKFLGLFGVAFVVSPALGADLGVYQPPLWSLPTWSGCYVGVNLGGVAGRDRDNWTGIKDVDIDTGTALAAAADASLSGSGVIGGGQFGCIAQTGAWVWGAEGDIQYTGLSESRTAISGTPPPFGPGQISESFSSHWLSTIRGRVGYATGPVLFYGTGGVAFAGVNFSDQVCFAAVGPKGCNAASTSSTPVGFAVGGGVEWAFAPSWSVRAEYLWVDLGTITFDSSPFLAITHNHHLTENIGRLGLNVRF